VFNEIRPASGDVVLTATVAPRIVRDELSVILKIVLIRAVTGNEVRGCQIVKGVPIRRHGRG
jgi:hypothetical protein